MSTGEGRRTNAPGRDPEELVVLVPDEPPALTPAAAKLLLKILSEASGQQE
ncbi:hypothetical protein GCM10012275_50570 [Longimycelium tulufanense]|uniref:Uncharacterized protein n=1 Tax=Longimycelium tulufanense TaxID=907463 RepID=A0A8J3CCI9_9PSEU|nr:hypothetical protein [Longimycelium tulufanense]GGM73724.1 hypothetical protein GCM10012275_50570 [Longimycelium tulufanense]